MNYGQTGNFANSKKYRQFNCNTSAGFSMIELAVVVAIIGLILLIAIPNFNRTLAQTRLETGASQLVSDLRLLQQDSRGREGSTRVQFDPAGAEYRLQRYSESTGTWATFAVRTLPTQVDLKNTTFTNNTLAFGDPEQSDPPGKPSSGGQVELEIDTYTLLATVSVTANSGGVSVTFN